MSKQIYSDRFEVQELIAEGGMGAVYKANDTKLARVVALKVVHTHLSSDSDFVERFRDEARKTARLQGHPNIVQIFDVANDQGTEYLVMEYFPSTNLRDQLRGQGKFPLRDAVNVTRQIAQALSHTHSCDIIHRDIKPANILLNSNQHVKLTDFGIAKALSDAPLTSTGQLIGTLKYMSPEQARNTILDGRTDLYSLGMVLYELVTGKNIWKDVPNLAIYGNLQAESTIPALSFPTEVPRGIQAVIHDLLRFNPADRIQNAQSLVARLEDLRSLWDDSDETIVKPPIQEPDIPDDDKTVAVLHPSSGPSGQKPARPPEKPKGSVKKPPAKPKKSLVEEIQRPVAPTESNTKKIIQNSVYAAMAILVLGSVYYFSSSEVEVTPLIEDNSVTEPITPVENKNMPTVVVQDATEAVRLAKADAEAKAQEAEKARVAQAKADAKAQAAEKARIAQEKASAKAQAAEEARLVEEKAAAEARAAEEARIAQAKADAKAQADKEAQVAQAEAEAKARAAEQARIAEVTAAAKAQALEEAQAAQAEAEAKARAAEKAREAEEKAIAEAQVAKKAREEEARAKAQAAEKAREAQARAKVQAAEAEQVAQEKATTQALAAKKAKEAQEKAKALAAKKAKEADVLAQVQAAEKARVARANAKAQAAKKAREAQEKAEALATQKAQEAEALAKAQAAEKARKAEELAKAKAADTQALMRLLEGLKTSIEQRNLKTLKIISTMSISRQKMLENLFATYQTIETSIGEFTRSGGKATGIIQITKLVRPNGTEVKPHPIVGKIKVTVPKNGTKWNLPTW